MEVGERADHCTGPSYDDRGQKQDDLPTYLCQVRQHSLSEVHLGRYRSYAYLPTYLHAYLCQVRQQSLSEVRLGRYRSYAYLPTYLPTYIPVPSPTA